MVIKVDKGENENIKVHDLDNYSFDAIDTILINTNWSNYNKLKKYFETNPDLSEEVATYLVEKRINFMGIDSPTIDPIYNSGFDSHKTLSNKVSNYRNPMKFIQVSR